MGKPKIRFKGYTTDWEQRKFADFTWDAGKRNKEDLDLEPYAITNEHGFIRQRDAHDDFGYMKDTDRKAYNIVQPNSFAYNPARINVGSIGYYKGVENVIVSSLYEVFQTDNYVNDRFLWHWLKSDEFPRWIEKLQEGSVRLYFYYDKLCECQLYMPSLEEQEKIASFLDGLDHLITLHQRKYEEMKTLKKYMLQKMFPQSEQKVPEIRFAGFTKAWEQRKFSDVAEYRNGKAHENEIDDDGEYIVVNSKFVSTNGEIKKFSNAQNEPLYENEIAFVLSDVPNGRAIARTFLIDKSGKYTLNQRIAGITPHEDTDPYYLHIKMNRNAYFLKFDDGNKQTNLSIKDVLNYEDMYPNYKEQQKIGNYFRSLDHLITLHQQKCEELKNIKKFMLQNMFV